MNELKERLARLIIAKSFRYSPDAPFTLASGKRSDYYFNCKPTTLDPEGMNLIGEIIFTMIRDVDVTACGGLTLGADAIANALSLISYQRGKSIKSFIVRREAKGHGTKSLLEGDLQTGERVLIIDDVITTGGSTITAITRAREAGLIAEQVVVLIDREEGGREAIMELGVEVQAVFTRSEIMGVYSTRRGYPTPADLC